MSEPNTLDHVRRVLDRHKAHILATYRAVGVGIGQATSPGTAYVITVYLQSSTDRPQEPVTMDGVPLRFTVTGPVRPLHPGEASG
ncbi:hypothetical protein [Streptomyces roseoverticillatus]|uniref:hypothetical protein n=1 Tax=Streptomyces roseoverticillatus TaxID=66429 RepID=UPI0004C10FF1|nr:hypothetical protein [Streptomyces roseoverticillatus]